MGAFDTAYQNPLTDLEATVLERSRQGLSTRTIAQQLGVKPMVARRALTCAEFKTGDRRNPHRTANVEQLLMRLNQAGFFELVESDLRNKLNRPKEAAPCL